VFFGDNMGIITLPACNTTFGVNFFMEIQLINIGFGNIVSANRVVAIVSPESAPIKRIITDARDRGQLVDATYGRRTRAVIITDSSHVILSAIQPETVANRFVISRDHHSVDN
jgi:extracellular matrix regulatory protein A